MSLGETLIGVGAIATPAAVLVSAHMTLRGQRQIKSEVRTVNGQTIAMLAESAEGRRIERDVSKDDRTTSEQGYVDRIGNTENGAT